MQPGDKPVLHGKRRVGLQPLEVQLQVFGGVVPLQEAAVDELVEIRAVIVEPGINVTRRPALIRGAGAETVDREMSKSQARHLADILLTGKTAGVPETPDQEIAQVPDPRERGADRSHVIEFADARVKPPVADKTEEGVEPLRV